MLDLLSAFRARHPHIEVTLTIGNSQQVVEALEDYRVDLAASSQLEQDPRFSRLVLGEDPLGTDGAPQPSPGRTPPFTARRPGR